MREFLDKELIMNTPFNLRTVSIMFFVALTTSYVLCILGGILFGWTMYEVWSECARLSNGRLAVKGCADGIAFLLQVSPNCVNQCYFVIYY